MIDFPDDVCMYIVLSRARENLHSNPMFYKPIGFETTIFMLYAKESSDWIGDKTSPGLNRYFSINLKSLFKYRVLKP